MIVHTMRCCGYQHDNPDMDTLGRLTYFTPDGEIKCTICGADFPEGAVPYTSSEIDGHDYGRGPDEVSFNYDIGWTLPDEAPAISVAMIENARGMIDSIIDRPIVRLQSTTPPWMLANYFKKEDTPDDTNPWRD